MKFNLNDKVTATLTEHGRKIWQDEIRDRCAFARRFGDTYSKHNGNETVITVQFHELMTVFGSSLNSGYSPFNMNLEVHDEESAYKFSVGDKVHKIDGYAFNGVIVSTFKTVGGARRVVVELVTSDGPTGMLHIFNETQMDWLRPDVGGT